MLVRPAATVSGLMNEKSLATIRRAFACVCAAGGGGVRSQDATSAARSKAEARAERIWGPQLRRDGSRKSTAGRRGRKPRRTSHPPEQRVTRIATPFLARRGRRKYPHQTPQPGQRHFPAQAPGLLARRMPLDLPPAAGFEVRGAFRRTELHRGAPGGRRLPHVPPLDPREEPRGREVDEPVRERRRLVEVGRQRAYLSR